MTDKKLNQAYYQPDRLWTSGKAIRKLHKITSLPKKDVKPWLAKQALWQIQNLMRSISLICFMCPIIYLKQTHINI